jgi:hypothetical protein
MKSRLLALSIAGLSALTIGLAAQSALADDTTPPADMPHAMHHRMDPAKFKARAEHRLDKLHSQLKLSADQEPAWTTYRNDSLTRLDTFIANRPAPGSMRDASAITRLEKRLQMMKQHETLLTQQLDSTRTFYAKLTPEQQKTFDSATRMQWQGKGMHRGGPAKMPATTG